MPVNKKIMVIEDGKKRESSECVMSQKRGQYFIGEIILGKVIEFMFLLFRDGWRNRIANVHQLFFRDSIFSIPDQR